MDHLASSKRFVKGLNHNGITIDILSRGNSCIFSYTSLDNVYHIEERAGIANTIHVLPMLLEATEKHKVFEYGCFYIAIGRTFFYRKLIFKKIVKKEKLSAFNFYLLCKVLFEKFKKSHDYGFQPHHYTILLLKEFYRNREKLDLVQARQITTNVYDNSCVIYECLGDDAILQLLISLVKNT